MTDRVQDGEKPQQATVPAGQLSRLLKSIGYIDDRDYLTDVNDPRVARHAHALRSAFGSMDVIGAFCPGSHLAGGQSTATPVVYVTASRSAADAERAHRAIWSQSLVPLILAITPEGCQVRNAFDPRETRGKLTPWKEVSGDHPSLAGIKPIALRSSISWSSFGDGRRSRVDTRLCRNIAHLNTQLRAVSPKLFDRSAVANAVIARVLYLLVLTDRGVVTQSYVDELTTRAGKKACPSLVLDRFGKDRPPDWTSTEFWRLSDAIDGRLNGTVFPLSTNCRRLVSDAAINLARDVLRRDEATSGDTLQFGLLDVDYAALRTETLAEVYEQFFAIENLPGKVADGAFYTPSYLVDYIVDETDGIKPFDGTSFVCDPAVGSGAFLVAAFRRIVEREVGSKRATAPLLRELLQRCIHGFETNAQAANVARLSLYLTMLDYLPGTALHDMSESGPALFPKMLDNIRVRDFFKRLPANVSRRATHVLGNPPWTKFGPDSPAGRYAATLPRAGTTVSWSSSAELFAWRALRDLCAAGATVSFVIEAKSFVGSKASGRRSFPSDLASAHRIRGVTNLGHFRRKLFEHADEAAVVVFSEATPPSGEDRTWLYSPLLTSQPLDRSGTPWAIVVDRGNVELSWQYDLADEPRSWFHALMLAPLDRAFAIRINNGSMQSLGAFMDAHGLAISRGGYEPETGVAAALHLGTDRRSGYVAQLGLSDDVKPRYALKPSDLADAKPPFATMFTGPSLLVPRSMSRFDVTTAPVAFNSSLQGIFFLNDDVDAETKTRVLKEIKAYLANAAVTYMLSLVGRTWILDQRRLEARDLRRLPFPYGSINELLVDGPTKGADTKLVARLMDCGLGGVFGLAVEDHHTLRAGFQNGKIPRSAAAPADDQRREAYRQVLMSRLQSMFSDDVRVDVRNDAQTTETQDIVVSIGPSQLPDQHIQPPMVVRDFLESSAVTVANTPNATSVRLSKPNAASFWTVDSAFNDAAHVAREILAQ